jgi:hypothetical protein
MSLVGIGATLVVAAVGEMLEALSWAKTAPVPRKNNTPATMLVIVFFID